MRRLKTYIVLLSCASLAHFAACSDDDGQQAVCGDGVIEGAEECEIGDLNGQTCADQVPGSEGNLACNQTSCTFDTAGCRVCGDGQVTFGEQCDCGSDAASKPASCPDINGGPLANCSAGCLTISVCGDGVKATTEQCDCGRDAATKPATCPDFNGGALATCDASCLSIAVCDHSLTYLDTCVPAGTGDDPCCDDDWGTDMTCVEIPYTPPQSRCIRECQTADDCYWSNDCFNFGNGGCLNSQCGMNETYAPGDPNTTCEFSNGNLGFCVPVFSRSTPDEGMGGLCFEAGTIAGGEVCPINPDAAAAVSGKTNAELYVDRTSEYCFEGRCLGTAGATEGICYQFCDPYSAYDAAIYDQGPAFLPCPADWACSSQSTMDPATGIHQGEYGLCVPSTTTDSWVPCSRVTGETLADPTVTCATSPDFTNGRCIPLNLGTEDSDGTLIGMCADGTVANRTIWQACTAQQICPEGTECMRPDAFTTNVLPTRCVPICDASHHLIPEDCLDATGLGAQLVDTNGDGTADATPVCQSKSVNLEPADILPTRYGYCVLP